MKMSEQTRVLGARRVKVPHPETGVEEWKWQKPVVDEYAVHAKNMAAKRKYKSGEETDPKKCFNKVPLYKGMGNKTDRQIRQNMKYAAKLASPAWQAEVERRKAA